MEKNQRKTNTKIEEKHKEWRSWMIDVERKYQKLLIARKEIRQVKAFFVGGVYKVSKLLCLLYLNMQYIWFLSKEK